jgi:hypothetical protein
MLVSLQPSNRRLQAPPLSFGPSILGDYKLVTLLMDFGALLPSPPCLCRASTYPGYRVVAFAGQRQPARADVAGGVRFLG